MDQGNSKQKTQDMRVAVASYEGMLVNQHLGMADSLIIFDVNQAGYRQIERRPTPRPGGADRWQKLAGQFKDCQALLVSSLGQNPLEILTANGLKVYEVEGLIEDALSDLYQGIELRMPAHAPRCRCSESSSAGQGCG